MANPKKPRTPCPHCGKEPYRASYTYCSNACQQEVQFKRLIDRWLAGKVNGLQSIGIVSTFVKKYLRRKFNNRCCLCGWSETNPKSGIVPLVADHIDGNWRNNAESNLRLLCPNCDSLTTTYSALNKGNGRVGRVVSNRVKEGIALQKEVRKQKKVRILPYTV